VDSTSETTALRHASTVRYLRMEMMRLTGGIMTLGTDGVNKALHSHVLWSD